MPGDAGDPGRIAATAQRLADLRQELLEGLGSTGFTAEQAAKMADAGWTSPRCERWKHLPAIVPATVVDGTGKVGNCRRRRGVRRPVEPLLGEPATAGGSRASAAGRATRRRRRSPRICAACPGRTPACAHARARGSLLPGDAG